MNQLVDPNRAQSDATAPHKGERFAFVQSCWHRAIVDQGREGFLSEMARMGVTPESIDLFEVPGAFEIPLLAKKLARSGRYKAVTACGLIVDGGIYRHEFVASAVIDALMAVQLETEVPVISAVLTPQNFHEHDEHQNVFARHFVTKGREAAAACLGAVRALHGAPALSAQA